MNIFKYKFDLSLLAGGGERERERERISHCTSEHMYILSELYEPPKSSILFNKKSNKMPANVAEVVALARKELGMIYKRKERERERERKD